MMPFSCHNWRNHLAAHASHPEHTVSPARQWLLGAALAFALAGIAGRLAYWQIARHAQLSTMAAEQQQHAVVIPAQRGTIFDRNGQVLALTVTEDAVVADPLVMQTLTPAQRAQTLQQIAMVTGVPTTVLAPQIALPTGYRVLTDATGATIHVAPDVASGLQNQIDAGALPGIALQMQAWREEPAGTLASQVLGFVQVDSGVGQYGIEAEANAWLAGRPGRVIAALDATGSPLASAPRRIIPSQAGADLTLTLDANLQAIAETGLQNAVTQTGATGGSVIIEEPQTGAILALANAPDFDPNHYAGANEATFQDPAIAAIYDPGSTMKAVTMAAGVDSGVITPATTIQDAGTITVAGTTLANWNHLAWGSETMTQVLQHSSNVGAAWVALQVGHDRFDHYLTNFGFGAPTDVTLPDEAGGMLAPQEPTTDLTNLDLAENGFGESIGVTPLQMVMAYGALANGGVLMRPQLVTTMTFQNQTRTYAPMPVRRVVSAQTAATVTQMLTDSALHGEAQTWLIAGYAVAAKTGTSTPDPKHPAITYASVIGYAPAQQPRFVVLVKLDHPQSSIYGGGAAGPLWRALVRQLLAYYHIASLGG
jgi:cell division protein FtsI/penicillin-binding protein 2